MYLSCSKSLLELHPLPFPILCPSLFFLLIGVFCVFCPILNSYLPLYVALLFITASQASLACPASQGYFLLALRIRHVARTVD